MHLRFWPATLAPEPANAMLPEEAAQLVEMWGARPCATAHVRSTLALLSPPWRPAALVAGGTPYPARDATECGNVLRNSLLALRYRRETAQQIEPSRHRNSRSLNNRQNLAKRSVNKPENLHKPRAQQAPYLLRLRSVRAIIYMTNPVLRDSLGARDRPGDRKAAANGGLSYVRAGSLGPDVSNANLPKYRARFSAVLQPVRRRPQADRAAPPVRHRSEDKKK